MVQKNRKNRGEGEREGGGKEGKGRKRGLRGRRGMERQRRIASGQTEEIYFKSLEREEGKAGVLYQRYG